jgi:hypothetical protein
MADLVPSDDGQRDQPATVAGEQLRASHADRDQIVELLTAAAGDGRLSPEELDERLERALSARTYAELAALTADLPATPGIPAVPAVVNVTPKDLVRIEVRSSTARRDGRWVVPKELDVTAASGTVTLDFTEAVITQPTLRIAAEVRSGTLSLITKPGIEVTADDVVLRAGTVSLPKPADHGTPVLLHIEVSGSVRSGSITAGPPRPPRPPRRTFWQWLRRAPRPRAIGA